MKYRLVSVALPSTFDGLEEGEGTAAHTDWTKSSKTGGVGMAQYFDDWLWKYS